MTAIKTWLPGCPVVGRLLPYRLRCPVVRLPGCPVARLPVVAVADCCVAECGEAKVEGEVLQNWRCHLEGTI